MKDATTKRRLRTLIKFMEKLPRSASRHFNMKWWFDHEGDHRHKVGRYIDAEALQHCGTTACALGWAATVPSFRRDGLRVLAQNMSTAPLRSGRRFFGLSREQFAAMFLTSSYRKCPMNDITTPKQWARKAKQLMKEWSAA